jgi:hypothetical protein
MKTLNRRRARFETLINIILVFCLIQNNILCRQHAFVASTRTTADRQSVCELGVDRVWRRRRRDAECYNSEKARDVPTL